MKARNLNYFLLDRDIDCEDTIDNRKLWHTFLNINRLMEQIEDGMQDP